MSPQATTPAPAEPQTMADRQIQRAEDLEYDRAELLKEIGANREFLRLMDKNGELSADQSKFLAVFYPEKVDGEKRSEADIEATRKAKEDARKRAATRANS